MKEKETDIIKVHLWTWRIEELDKSNYVT